MKIKAMLAVLFLTVIAGSSAAHAVESSDLGACYITTEYGTTCFLATADVCESHNNLEYGVTAQWVTGTCSGEETPQGY